MASSTEIGKEHERLAEEFLLSAGNRVLVTRNYRLRAGEIDLILEETRSRGRIELVFVEVRVRTAASWQDGVESVDFRKRRKLIRTIRQFLAHYRGRAQTLRADILAWDGQAWTHLQDAWLLD